MTFDIGGTWFRSAISLPEGKWRNQRKVAAASFSRFPSASVEQLQEMLVGYLASEAKRQIETEPTELIGVSMGAAIDSRSGRIIGASPLWGPTRELEFDIEAALAKALPDCRWVVVNDVTAAAIGLASEPQFAELSRFAVVTISSGLAMRTIEPRSGRIPTSVYSGLQGELGHLPASFAFKGKSRSLRCACGDRDHLSSFSSGRAINELLKLLEKEGCSWLSNDPSTAQLSRAVAAKNPDALDFLDSVTEPLAKALLCVLAIDPDIERIALTGGVVDGLGPTYVNSVLRHMSNHGLYGSRLVSPADFAKVVSPVAMQPSPTMYGAAHWARCQYHSNSAGNSRLR